MRIKITRLHERQLSPSGVAGVAPRIWRDNHAMLPPHECGIICKASGDSMALGFKEGVFYALTVLGLVPNSDAREIDRV